MNREEAIKILKEHLDHWMRLHKECICTKEEGENTIEALDMAIKALEQKPCGDAIDRAEAIKVASGYCHPANVAKELAKLPPVNPTKTGHWIVHSTIYGRLICDRCRSNAPHDYRTNYCPNCGARMVEPQESEDRCKNCEYYRNPDYTRCHECKAESEDKE